MYRPNVFRPVVKSTLCFDFSRTLFYIDILFNLDISTSLRSAQWAFTTTQTEAITFNKM